MDMYRMHGATEAGVPMESIGRRPLGRLIAKRRWLGKGVVSAASAKHDATRVARLRTGIMESSGGGVSGRVALVTGAGAPDGIGFATARLLAEAGAKVAITSTTTRIFDRLKALPAEDAAKAAFAADLAKPKPAHDLVAAVKQRFGRLDILVNNAGMLQTGRKGKASPVARIGDDEWHDALAINLDTCFFVTRAAIPLMLRRRYGRIVNIASVSGPLVIYPNGGAYGAAKAAMTGYTRALAFELGSRGITANAVAPGWIDTGSSTEIERRAGRATPIGRPGRPEEVGAVALFLASEQASYLTGQVIVVDGGNIIQEIKGS